MSRLAFRAARGVLTRRISFGVPSRTASRAARLALACAGVLAFGCGGGDPQTPGRAPGAATSGPGQMGSSILAPDDSTMIIGGEPSASAPIGTNQPTTKPPNCGDGFLNNDEVCDDGNETAGDGCSPICGAEDGYSCLDGICTRVPLCGDGTIDIGESCDDGNAVAGDGCTDLCVTEPDFACPVGGEACKSLIECGDIHLNGPETCDDGNKKDGDGCSATCQTEPGWVCVLGQACTAKCGDGLVGPGEACDDSNTDAGDGCSATCAREPSTGDTLSWDCPFDPVTKAGGKCTQAVCGDGVKGGDEGCDDGGNNNLGDGCSPGCKLEPDCKQGACVSTCGDGLILASDNEDCDDGNNRSGDGCSADCKIEGGFTCEKIDTSAGNTLTLPIVYRDFRGKGRDDARNLYDAGGHVDFENYEFTKANPSYLPANGIVAAQLSTDPATLGKPVYAATSQAAKSVTTSKASFDQWFNDVPGVNMTLLAAIDLSRTNANAPYTFDSSDFFPLDDAGFVEDGTEKARSKTYFDVYESADQYGCWDALLQETVWDTEAPTCTDAIRPNIWDPVQEANLDEPCVDRHNYSFTSEIRYWFEYKGGEQLVFRGDDDVFVFINKQLVVDLGGLHEPLGGDVCGNVWPLAQNENVDPGCDATSTDTNDTGVCLTEGERSDGSTGNVGIETVTPDCDGLGAGNIGANLEPGKVYEVAVFQAERHTCQSNYQLTLSGFSQSSSTCTPTCGDGIQTAGEACDEGPLSADGLMGNGAGYNHCTAQCTFGPRCGDGMVQADAGEVCDNGLNISQYQDAADACAPGCKAAPTCGDGVFAPQHESCDLGAANNMGAYGTCNANCSFAPRCGDSNIDDADGETCDDGNRKNGDGCNAACKKERPIIQG